MTKLHLGNGTVYLTDYINIDFMGELAENRPDLVEHNRTTVEKYYKYPFRENKGNNVSDVFMDVRHLEFEDNSVDEILNVNLVDHMPKEDFLETLKEWRRVLKVGGRLIIDVDDRVAQAQMLIDAKTYEEIEWALRLIYCDHANKGRTHYWGYSPKYLKQILTDNGFTCVWIKNDYIIHSAYPNFQICVQK